MRGGGAGVGHRAHFAHVYVNNRRHLLDLVLDRVMVEIVIVPQRTARGRSA
ncbi:MAG: hypothetical protein U0075_21255 [Thermomicrobiales bacterium]